MKVFCTSDFKGKNPVGTCALVVARDKHHARLLLRQELAQRGLTDRREDGTPCTLKEVALKEPSVDIVSDGDY